MLPWWWSPQRMMSNNVSESEKEIPTGCVSFYTQWFDVCVLPGCFRPLGMFTIYMYLYYNIFICAYISISISLVLSISLCENVHM